MSKYSVDPTAVRPALAQAKGAIATFGSAGDLEAAVANASSALPIEYAEATSALNTIKSEHHRDYKALLDFATSSVEAVIECMNIYEHASADMVAQERQIHNKIAFEAPWGGGNLQNWLSSQGDKSSDSKPGTGFSAEGERVRDRPFSPSQESGSRSSENWNSSGSNSSGSNWSTSSDNGTVTATSQQWDSSSNGTSSYGGAVVTTSPNQVTIVGLGAATNGGSAALVGVGASASVIGGPGGKS